MSEALQVGQILDGPKLRDAIHVAMIPVMAGQPLGRGQRVSVSYAGKESPPMAYEWCNDDGSYDGSFDGVVDPFLEVAVVPEGAWFWLWLRPGSVTGLRHEWTSPVFPGASTNVTRDESIAWLTAYANRYGTSYERMMECIPEGHATFGDTDGPPDYRSQEDQDEFWRHVENALMQKFSQERRKNTLFRCAC